METGFNDQSHFSNKFKQFVGATPRQLIGIFLFLGGIVTLLAVGFFNWGMSRITASKASVFINLVPVNAILIGWIVLGESLTLFQCMAAVLVISGVLLSQTYSKIHQ